MDLGCPGTMLLPRYLVIARLDLLMVFLESACVACSVLLANLMEATDLAEIKWAAVTCIGCCHMSADDKQVSCNNISGCNAADPHLLRFSSSNLINELILVTSSEMHASAWS